MANSLVGFIEYKGTKESLLSNTTIKDGDIVFGYDETSDISYIYHNGVFYSNTSELSEVLPEIYIGDAPPLEGSSAVVWYQTNVDIPDSPTEVVETCTVYGVYDGEDPRVKMTHEWALSNKDAFIKIENSRKNGTPLNINIVVPFYNGTEVLYEDCYVVSGGEYSYALQSATVVKDMSNPYISYVEISTFTNGFKYYEEGQNIPGCYADIHKTPLTTDSELLKHTTTYIGTGTPSNKYNLWVDTTNEEVLFKYKEGNEWKVLSTGGSGNIEVDTVLDPTSENPIANKAVYELATVIGEDFKAISKDLLKKASTENGLVEGRGFKVNDNLKYYLPNTTVTTDPTVDDTHIIATKADTLSNEVIDSKATVYNLYAMDGLTPEQVAANEAALVSVQNREIAIYKVYTSDDTYAIADVKLVPGPYLEAYVYVSNPDTTSEQVTVTKYTYTFNQAGEYTTIDKQEVVVPSLSKVEEMIDELPSGGGGITEEKEVYIGTTPTEEAKLWIDPTGTPSGGNGGGTSGGGHILVYWYKLTDEQKAHNATAYQQILNEFKVGRFPQVIVADTEIAAADSMGIIGVYGGYPATYISITDPDSQAAEMLGEIAMGINFSDTGGEKILYITPDGVEHNYND